MGVAAGKLSCACSDMVQVEEWASPKVWTNSPAFRPLFPPPARARPPPGPPPPGPIFFIQRLTKALGTRY